MIINEILNILDLSKKSGFPDARVPMVFRGATEPLKTSSSCKWHDTKPIVTEASEAILAAARGASPDNPLGRYLEKITPASPRALFDVAAIAVVINNHLAKIEETEIYIHGRYGFWMKRWLTYIVPSVVLGPDQEYRWKQVDSPTNVQIIHDINEEAMKADFFNTLNGKPTALPPMR